MNKCTGCGNATATIEKLYCELCPSCWDVLVRELQACRVNHQGPRFLAIFYTGESTLGYGLYISETPRGAMNESRRLAERNGWQLLRVDIQNTMTDIYVSQDHTRYMPHSIKNPLSYDETKYGTLEPQ